MLLSVYAELRSLKSSLRRMGRDENRIEGRKSKLKDSNAYDLQRFSSILANLLDVTEDEVEKQIRKLSMTKKISFEQFEHIQSEFQKFYTNPNHPLDLELTYLNQIRNEFQEASIRAKNKNQSDFGIPLNNFSSMISRKMNMDQSSMEKFLQKSAFFSSITWNEFQSMLDKESNIREELLDWFMYKDSADDLNKRDDKSLHEKGEYNLKPTERTSQRNYIIEFLLEIKVDQKQYFLTVFDESTNAIYTADTFQSALEFIVPQDVLPAPAPDTHSLLKKNKPLNLHNDDEDHNLLEEPTSAINLKSQVSFAKSPSIMINIKNNNSNSNMNNSSLLSTKKRGQSMIANRTPVKGKFLAEYLSQAVDFEITENPEFNQSFSENKENRRRLQTEGSFTINSDLFQSPISIGKFRGQSREETFTQLDQSPFQRRQAQQQFSLTPKINFSSESKERCKSMLIKPEMIQFPSNLKSPLSQQTNNQSIFTLSPNKTKQKFRQNSFYGANTTKTSAQYRSTQTETANKSFVKAIDYLHPPKINLSAQPVRAFSTKIVDFSLPKEASRERSISTALIQPEILPSSISTKSYIKKESKREQALIKLLEGYNHQPSKIEDDPDLYKIIKAYLTSEIKDEEKKKLYPTLEQFYLLYKKDPNKYQHKQQFSSQLTLISSSINNKSLTEGNEENYLLKDDNTRETIKKLWKRFSFLPSEYSAAYAKAVNEIIKERNLKNVNADNLKTFFRKQMNSTTSSEQKSQREQLNLSLNKTPKSLQPKKQKDDLCNKYLRDMRDIDEWININPWTNEWRQKPEHQAPLLMKEYQQKVEQRIKDKKNMKLKVNKRGEFRGEEDEFAKKSESQHQSKSRNNRIKTLTIEFCNELSLLALGMINRQLQLYFASHIKSRLEIKKIHVSQFGDCIVGIAFKKNVVTQKWNIGLLFENDVLQIFEVSVGVREQKITRFALFYSHSFSVEVDRLSCFKQIGFVLASYKGDFFIFQDHLTSESSGNEIQYLPQYYLDQENKLTENGMALSITSFSCSEQLKILIFGTSKGKIAFFDIMSKEFLGINQAGEDQIVNIHVYQNQNQVIALCLNNSVTVWDIARRSLIQSFKGGESGPEKSKISTSLFSHEFEQLLVASSSLKIWEMKVNKDLQFKERKMLSLYEWRKKEIEKQDRQLLLEKEKLDSKGIEIKLEEDSSPLSKLQALNKNKNAKRKKIIKKEEQTTALLRQAISSGKVIVTWDTAGEVKIISVKHFKIKYSFMLQEPEGDSIEYIDILNSKVLAFCTEKGDIYLKNLYTDEMCQKITEYDGYPLKLSIVIFLPEGNQMTLAAASQEGKVIFFSTYLQIKSNKKFVKVDAHKKRVTTLVQDGKQVLVSVGEDNFLAIISLRSCSIIYKVDLSLLGNRSIVQSVRFCNYTLSESERSSLIVILEDGQAFELSKSDGSISSLFKQRFGKYVQLEVDTSGHSIVAVDDDLEVTIWKKNNNFIQSSSSYTNYLEGPLKKSVSQYQQNSWFPIQSQQLNLKKHPLIVLWKEQLK